MIIQTIKLVLFAVIIALFGVMVFNGFQMADRALQQYKHDLDIRAVHDCAMDYRTESTNTTTGITTIRPMEQQVRDCAWQKGVKWDGVWSDLIR